MSKLPLIEFDCEGRKCINLQGFKCAECRDVFFEEYTPTPARSGVNSVPRPAYTSYQLIVYWKHNLQIHFYWHNDKNARDLVYDAIIKLAKEMNQ